MAEATSGQQDIRSLEIDKYVKGYEEEALVFKTLVNQESTSSREIRWYQKSSGYLNLNDETADMSNVAEGARPFVMEQSWTRNTSHIKKFFIESQTITMEDESDNDVSVLTGNAEDLTDAIANQEDQEIWNVATEDQSPTNINSVSAGTPWDAGDNENPIADIIEAKKKIREQTNRPLGNARILLSPKDEESVLNYIIDNGSQFTEFAGSKVQDGVLTVIAGLTVTVSANVTDDYALVGNLEKAVTWKEFNPITARILEEEGIGKKIRVWAHGAAILERPKFLTLIDNTQE